MLSNIVFRYLLPAYCTYLAILVQEDKRRVIPKKVKIKSKHDLNLIQKRVNAEKALRERFTAKHNNPSQSYNLTHFLKF